MSEKEAQSALPVQITGIHMQVGEALSETAAQKLRKAVGKYSERPVEARISFSRQRHLVEAECVVHLHSGRYIQAHGSAADAHSACDMALTHLAKQLRRGKRRNLARRHQNSGETLP